ncbi:MAG: hypothetical protein FJW27_13165 [Acidimicrobiia bacterium]|nr:hypothetical protein [Acidimicrobiia bacterium]
MTNHVTCTYPGDREGAIIDYLYGETDAADRNVFERHIVGCAVCRAELDEYRGVQRTLSRWAPPEPDRTPEFSPLLTGPRLAVPKADLPASSPAPTPRFVAMPIWARVAAAVLCVGVGAGAANFRVTYSPEGLTMRTGWLSDAPPSPASSASQQPWRTELAAMADELRREMQSRNTP